MAIPTTDKQADPVQISQRDLLIESHRSYVRAMASEIARTLPGHVELDELIAWGNLGLVEAAERYDPRYQVSFQTFSWYRIRGAIYDAVRQMTPLSRADYARYRQAANRNDLIQTAADDALHYEHSARAVPLPGIDDEIAQTREIIDVLIPVYLLSLDSEELPELVAEEPSKLEQMEYEELLAHLKSMVAELNEDDRQLIENVYFNNLSLVDYAARIGVTKSWTSRLHARAIRRLREIMIRHELLSPD